jgi:D-tyrosyl-tRNA(Tyr) deacylase
MKAVVQRVSRGAVEVDGREVASIARGIVALVGIEQSDTPQDLAWMADKLAHLRIFEDAAGKMNLSVAELRGPDGAPGGSILLVPNFTVAGDARKGRRPSFDAAMRPEQAEPFFQELARSVAAHGVPVQTGVFRAHMLVNLVNDGPVTIVLESPRPAAAAMNRSNHG